MYLLIRAYIAVLFLSNIKNNYTLLFEVVIAKI